MKKRVAVEQTLRNVGQFLSEKGYEIASLDPLSESKAELHNVNAVIISGQDENLMGMEDTKTRVPVIDARGMTPENIYQHLQQLEQNTDKLQVSNAAREQKAYKGYTKTEV
ncbi:YkuS family protein [Metallumcola ferriviriculae]|uniref:YkuS family protein n=1 Tax=Metallumcola ferriviriculae TaxID=3039180 RepID=A0AAU0ULQ5_9FIRM|nr:YkuS family protein [Desulfitibacteraceae bacterium MK1]